MIHVGLSRSHIPTSRKTSGFFSQASTVKRGPPYYFEVFAPSLVLGVAVGLWTWSWKWFGYALAIGVALISLTQSLMYLLWR